MTMEIQQAINIIYQLIELSNASGAFKKLNDLDTVREAYTTIVKELTEPTEKKKNESPG
jgi:hypothetical protein